MALLDKLNADTWIKYKKCDELRVAAPRSVADAVEIKSISEDGIFEVGKGGIFTKSYRFSDINYATSSVDEQRDILENWARWLNSNREQFKITFFNKNRDMEKFKNDILFAHRMDVFDDLRDAFNDIIEESIINSRQSIEQDLLITVRTDDFSSYDDAKNHFKNLENEMSKAFTDIGSRLSPLNATERLRAIHDVYRMGKEEEFDFDFRSAIDKGWDFKESVEPRLLDFASDENYFRIDDKFAAAIYIRKIPDELTDRFLTDLFALNIKMVCSIDTYPMTDEDVNKRLKKLYLGVQKSIRKQNKKRLKEKDFSSEISIDTQYAENDIKGIINDIRYENQRMFWTGVNIIIINESVEGLKRDVDSIQKKCGSGTSIDYASSQQKEALNTVLPIGVKQVDFGIPLETRSLCALFPFNIQELMVAGGNWYGSNKVSKNICLGNRKKLMNPHGLVFGVTGSGKTGCVTLEILQNFLHSEDDIIIIDPKSSDTVFQLVSDCHGAIIDISTTSNTYVNPLEYYGSDDRVNIADEKAEIVLSILEACKKEPLDARERSIANRCLKYIYKDSLLGTGINQPTLEDLYNEFDKLAKANEGMESDVAADLKLYLELFVKGSLNIFAKPTNVNVNNRVICYGLANIGATMWDLGILVMLEHITERIRQNYEANKATWIYIDEIGTLFQHQESQNYILSLWKKVRYLGGICTGIMQNVSEILQNNTTAEILENSEYVMVLRQQTVAHDNLVEALGITYEQIKYITSEAGKGKGLLKCGQTIVPMDMTIPETSELYKYVDTDAHKKFANARANKQ